VINNCNVIDTPPNIGKLRHLRTLSTFVVGSKAGCGLTELHSLKLGGTLRIKGLENVPNEWDAKQANLISKKELNNLDLSWGGSANLEGSNVNVERVLEALQPPSSLKSFGIEGYKGRQLSSWMRNGAILRDLVEFMLWNCNNCEELPPLGKLPQLKRLILGGMKNVKWIDGEWYDGVEEKAFPSLEELIVEDLPKLERILREEGAEMLPRLSELTIGRISNLKFPRLPSVENISIREAASLMEGVVENMPRLKTLKIEGIKGVVVLPDQLSGLGLLQELSIYSCNNLQYFSEHMLEGLTSLRSLIISNCEKLKSLSEGVRHLTCLESLSIFNCPELVTLPSNMTQLTAIRTVNIKECSTLPYGLQCIPSLRTLDIYGYRSTSLPDWLGDMTSLQKLEIQMCSEMMTLPSDMTKLTALRILSIRSCSTLPNGLQRFPSVRTLDIEFYWSTSLPDWLGDMTSLQKLEFRHCRELRSVPSSIQRLTNLSSLIISECPYLKKRCMRETGEDWQYIKYIPKIEVDSYALPEEKSSRFSGK